MWFNIIKDDEEDLHPVRGLRGIEANFDYDDIDIEAWKNAVGEEPTGEGEEGRDLNIQNKVRYIREALLSYDFINRHQGELGEGLGVILRAQNANEFELRLYGGHPFQEGVANNTHWNKFIPTQDVIEYAIQFWLRNKPERTARGFLEEIMNDPNIDARILEDRDEVRVVGSNSGRVYYVPLNWDEANQCYIKSELPYHRRPRENIINDKNVSINGLSFEDLELTEDIVWICFTIGETGERLPRGDKIGAVVLALGGDENKTAQNVITLAAFLGVNEIPDWSRAYGLQDMDDSPRIIDVSSQAFLGGGAPHPFSNIPTYPGDL